MKKSDAKKYAMALMAACKAKKKWETDNTVQAFVLHWGSRGRVSFLTAVLDEMLVLDMRARGREQIECRLAHVNEKGAHALTASLAQACKKDVDVSIVEDSSLIAGAVFTIGDTRIDGSIKARLSQLIHSLQ
jgi:F-type H+-transporting ATPase subunit delta